MAQQERQYLIAININAGIITLIDYNGEIKQYRQRGLNNYNEKQLKALVNMGLLDAKWQTIPELPKYKSIYFEDPETQGRAQATYPSPEKVMKTMQVLKPTQKSKNVKLKRGVWTAE